MEDDQKADWAIQSIQVKKDVPLEKAKELYKKIIKRNPRKMREEGEWIRFRVVPPTKFIPKSFRTKTVNDNIHITFGIVKPEHKTKMTGGSIFDYFTKAYDYVANKASDAFSYVKNAVSITDYSATTKKLLEEYGKNEIARMTIRRVPIAFAIDLALQGVSAGKWEELKEKYGFDKFYHLSLVVYLKNAWEKMALRTGRKIPKQLSLEKLEVVSVNERVEPVEGQEEQDVPIPKGQKITINGMFEKTRQRMGETAFFSYSALGHNNCQDFVSNLLQSEGLYREPEKEFVFQDLSELAKELPESTHAISQGITHLGALANKYLGIGGAKNVGGAKIGLNDLLHPDDIVMDRMRQEGGTKQSGFIRAMMARDKAQEAGQDVDTVENKKKFKYLDKKGFKIQKLTKTTHDLAHKKKARLPMTSHRQMVEQFYDYVIANAPAHKPDWDRGIHYGDTYDLDDLFTKWNQSRGAEVREKRQEKREAPEDESFSIPDDFFKLPVVRKRPKIAPVPPPVVPIEELPEDIPDDQKDDEKEEVVLGKFEDPKTKFQQEINKLVDFSLKNLHYDDLIADVLSVRAGSGTKGIPTSGEMVVMYYFILKYKIPILDFGYEETVYVPKDPSVRSKYKYQGDRTVVKLYNVTEYATEAVQKKNVSKIYEEVSLHLSKGEQQLLFYTNLGLRGKSLHANFVLIRAVDKKVYLIDPHGGQSVKDYKAQYEKQKKIFGGLAEKLGYEYVPSEKSSPILSAETINKMLDGLGMRTGKQYRHNTEEEAYGFQAVEGLAGYNTGFCGWWNAFLIELCCLKPEMAFEAVYREVLDILRTDPMKCFNAIVKYQYTLQQEIVRIAEKSGMENAKHAELHSLLKTVAVSVSDSITQLKEKRKEILGYAKPI